jgi:cell division septation protein DedD
MRLLLNLVFFAFQMVPILSQSFQSFDPVPAPLIEWDQTNYTYYTGQTIQMFWTSQGFGSNDNARIQYTGSGGTRTLTPSSGTPIQAGTYQVRLSDSSNGVATNQPLTIASSSNTGINLQSTQRITVIQSKLMNIVPLDDTRILGSGQTTFCDNRNLTVIWRGLGQAQFGVATVTLRRQSGLSGTQTLVTVSNVPVSGNTSVLLFCPRSVSPSTSNPYAFEISVQEPGGSAYTGTSPTFNFLTAPSPSATPSTTPSMTRTPSITPSSTPTPTGSPSTTSTMTASSTPTPSPTPTPAASLDLAGIARAAAESVDTQTPAIAGALGGIGGLLLLLSIWKWYQNKRMTEHRKKKLAMSSRFAREAQSMYGISPSIHDIDIPQQPSIVMYSVQGVPPSSKKQMESYKKAFPPKTTNQST